MDARREFRLLPLAVLLLGMVAQGHASPPPPPWAARDVGVFDAPGSADVDSRGVWTLRAVQGEAPLSPDAFFLVSQPLAGDGSIIALLLGQEGGNPAWGRAGVMIVEREAARARAAQLHMTTGHGLAFSVRSQDVNPLETEFGERRYGPRRFPTWLRLQREGDRFTPFTSSDGFGWTQLRAPIVLHGFPKSALAGLTIASAYGGPVTGIFSYPVVAPGLISPIVRACTGSRTVLLSWSPVTNAIGYMVRRSGPNTSAFAADLLTPDPIKESSFADTNLRNDQPVRYLVSALFEQDGRIAEGWSTALTVTPVALPANLFGCDVNLEATLFGGGITVDPVTGVYTIASKGGEIGNSEDRFFFACQLVKGDFQITARILGKLATTSGAAGVMVRETLEGPSRMAFLAGVARTGVTVQYRMENAGPASRLPPVISDNSFKPPLFLRLVRRGATITPFVSVDGTTFTPAGAPQTFEPPLAESLYLGYAITAPDRDGAMTTNTFSDLSISPPP
jgi:hypothetical protein